MIVLLQVRNQAAPVDLVSNTRAQGMWERRTQQSVDLCQMQSYHRTAEVNFGPRRAGQLSLEELDQVSGCSPTALLADRPGCVQEKA
jgi:hypothetical protein